MSYSHPTVRSYARVRFGRSTTSVVVPVAIAFRDRVQGLLGVSSLGTDGGMLFMVPEDEAPSMTMKDMLMPLDFIFMDHRRVVGVQHVVPAGQVEPVKPPGGRWVPWVLEMRPGFAYDRVIKAGDPVAIEMLVQGESR